jgi:hypothetical protein
MPSYNPIIKNDAAGATFYASLLDAANPGAFKITPTLAAGDFKISLDGGAFANLATLPVVAPAGGSQVKFVLQQAETNGDNLTIQCVDQTAPKEWVDAFIRIQTTAASFDTIQADTDNLQTRLPTALVGGRIDAAVGAVQSTTNLGYTVPSIGRGTVAAGATDISLPTSAFTPSGGAANQFAGRVVLFDFNTATNGLRGCARGISASSLAALPTLTIDQLPTFPSAGDTFSVI